MASAGIQREVLAIPISDRKLRAVENRLTQGALGSSTRPQPGHRDLVPVHRRHRDDTRRRAEPPVTAPHGNGRPGRGPGPSTGATCTPDDQAWWRHQTNGRQVL
jgi:hypothetical protein